jgi:hypothetical protein
MCDKSKLQQITIISFATSNCLPLYLVSARNKKKVLRRQPRKETEIYIRTDVIVEPQKEPDCFCCQVHCTGRHQKRLDDVFLENVSDKSLANVDACILLSLRVTVPQLGYDGDGVEAGVLSQRSGDNLERLGVGLETVRFHPDKRLSILCQKSRDVNFWGTASSNQGPG